MNFTKFHFKLSSKQLLTLTVIISLAAIGNIALYKTLAKNEKEALSQDFMFTSKEVISKIEKEIILNLEALNSLHALYSVTDSISREQFRIFNTEVLNRINSIQALEWIPKVMHQDKIAFETMAYKDGLREFKITQRVDEDMVPVSTRETYYPVFYMEPLSGNEKALGFDLGSDKIRLAALNKALQMNSMAATSKITLVQEKTSQNGILVFNPIKRNEEHLGFVLGVFRVGDLITRALGVSSNETYNLKVFDVSGLDKKASLQEYEPYVLASFPNNERDFVDEELQVKETLKMADRDWLVLCTPTQAYLSTFSNTAELILIICIILSIGIFYYFRRNFIEANQILKNQLVLETKVKERTRELEDYAYVVSHDLKSPLRSIEALVSWIKEDNITKFSKDSLNNFKLVEATLEKMEMLITDILAFSSIDSSTKNSQNIDLNELVNNLKTVLLIPEYISLRILKELPVVNGDPVKIQQVFQNLIENAIKFIDKKEGIIEIDVLDMKTYYQFSIKDNGIGIDEKFHDRVFKLFQSLKGNDESTGIGLSIVKKIVTQYQGDIWIESKIGKGSTFFFTLKKNS